MTQNKCKVAVLGAGSWGTALSALIATHGYPTILWGRSAEVVASIQTTRCNPRYFPDNVLPQSLQATTDFLQAVKDADCVLIATPCEAFKQTLIQLEQYRLHLGSQAGILWATKGFEPGTGRFLHEVAKEVMGNDIPLAVLTGPSFALEVMRGLPTAVTVHSDVPDFFQRVADIMHGPMFRVYTGTDMLGAELCGAMKNVLAVAAGVADGMQLGFNARAGLITRGLNEMLRLAAAIGARAETLMGLAGLGDLVLTCTGDLSRNRQLGLALGRGQSLADATQGITQVIESLKTADEVMRLADKYHVDLPISRSVQAVLRGQITVEEGVHALLHRNQKPEFWHY